MSTSASVLFDAPGPKTKARHRLYTLAAAVLLLGVLGFFAWRMAATDQFAYDKWEVFLTPDYIAAIGSALWRTVQMAAFSILLAVVFGLVFGVGKMSGIAPLRWISWAIVEFFRAVPVLLMMVFFFIAFSIGDGPLSPFWCVVLALMFYNGSVLAEVFRAGVNAVPPGQAEAGQAIGLRGSQVMRLIQLPQAVKIMLPSIVSQCIVALKDTSLGAYILAPGLSYLAAPIYQEFRNAVPTILVFSALYIAVNLILTALANWLQRRYVGEKRV